MSPFDAQSSSSIHGHLTLRRVLHTNEAKVSLYSAFQGLGFQTPGRGGTSAGLDTVSKEFLKILGLIFWG